MDNLEILNCEVFRRYGIEIELNAFDGIARGQNDPPPVGIDYVGLTVNNITKQPTQIKTWHPTHNNSGWVIKPDGSAGIEICSPILKGWRDLKTCCELIEEFNRDEKIQADDRCSFHAHFNLADLDKKQIAKILAYWIKCEIVFMDSVPSKRKLNRYCQLIGMTDLFMHDFKINPSEMIKRLGRTKYYSINTYHMARDSRQTMEFRIMENESCIDPFAIKNWVRLILHFIDRTIKMELPVDYIKGDPWSGLLWLDTFDVLKLLGFDGNYELSPGLKQVRDWFIGRMKMNINNTNHSGILSKTGRSIALQQLDSVIEDIRKKEGYVIGEEHVHPTDLKKALYSEEFLI